MSLLYATAFVPVCSQQLDQIYKPLFVLVITYEADVLSNILQAKSGRQCQLASPNTNTMETDSDSGITIRRAEPNDIPSVNKIHTFYVQNTVITFNTVPYPDEVALDTYISSTSRGLLYLVATQNDQVIGYCYSVLYRGFKEAYQHTVEVSVYLSPAFTGNGIGTRLLQKFIDILRAVDKDPTSVEEWFVTKPTPIKSVIACMAVDEDPEKNKKIQYFQDHFGFRLAGTLEKVGFKFGKW
jgi:L-amino acid N-acyltransferase YncA